MLAYYEKYDTLLNYKCYYLFFYLTFHFYASINLNKAIKVWYYGRTTRNFIVCSRFYYDSLFFLILAIIVECKRGIAKPISEFAMLQNIKRHLSKDKFRNDI